MIDAVMHDLRHASRVLRRSPGFTAVAVLSLAFGIGMTVAVFSIVNGLLFRPLPYADARRLVDIFEHHPTEVCAGCGVGTSWIAFGDIRAARTLSSAAAYRTDRVAVVMDDGAELRSAAWASASLFPLLGVAPLRGRAYTPAEDRPGGEPVVVLGEALWRSRFGGRSDVVGRMVRVNGAERTVVGIMPERFTFPAFAELWLPIAPEPGSATRADRGLGVVARLAGGATPEMAAAELGALASHTRTAFPATNEGWTTRVEPLRAELARDYATSFFLMLGIVGFVLLVACANVASLVLVRTTVRRHELAVRAHLGASRAALVRHVLAESMLVATLAGALALLLARWAIDAFRSATAAALPVWLRIDVDVRVVVFAVGLALVTGLLAGLVPALLTTRSDPGRALHEGGRGATATRGAARVRDGLVAVQVAAAMVLLAGAAQFTQQLSRVTAYRPGYDMEGLFGARVSLSGPSDDDPRTAAAALEERIGAVPGARSVALSSVYIPGFPGTAAEPVRIDGGQDDVTDAVHRVYNVTPGYFGTLGITLLGGRDFAPGDGPGGMHVAIVGRALADRLWPGLNPLGHTVELGAAGTSFRVVGVVPSGRASPFARDTARAIYVPMAQHPETRPAAAQLALHLRADGAAPGLAAQIRTAVAEVDPDYVVDGLESERAGLDRAAAPVRVTALATGALGLFAMVLAAMGVFGVTAHAASRRIAEIGVRMALGATRPRILRMVLRDALVLGGVGVVFGTMGALALAGVLRRFMVGIQPLPLVGLTAMLGGFLGLVLAASWLPARRAAGVDPLAALRTDG